MKSLHQEFANKPSAAKEQSGAALVLVLTVLVLLAGLVLAIFYLAQTNRQSSSLFANKLETRLLADSAVNIVITQITDATTQSDRLWVSQPGLIRTFTGNKSPDVNYRLFSWGDLQSTGAFDPFDANNAPDANWQGNPALYVDLNEPMPDPDAPGDFTRDRYPILYPPDRTESAGGQQVAGYSVTNPYPGTNPVPMPVQWLYVLQDGSVEPAADAGNSQISIGTATEENPIVGRIAFWADDESTKVNINTASGGKFWSEPRFLTNEERNNLGSKGFGFTQPVKGEYQRYPGHPARTDLQAVFPELSWEDIYGLAPRISAGGSENGLITLATDSITGDADRLYASIGELRFNDAKSSAIADRSGQSSSLSDAAWEALLSSREGFLTAVSRSPELTAFGTPRIASWPIPDRDDAPAGLPYRTALDRLIAFCSTITSGTASYPFYFTRRNPLSATEDIELPRNAILLDYLKRLTNVAPPGLAGNSFASKYGVQGRDQILTEIFDYIRIINLLDQQLSTNRRYASNAIVVPSRTASTSGFGRMYSVRQAGLIFICNADSGVPASNRAPGTPALPAPNETAKENLSLDPNVNLQANQRRIQAIFVVELFNASAGFKGVILNPFVRVRGLGALTINGSQNLGFLANEPFAPRTTTQTANYIGGFGQSGGATNYRWLLQSNDAITTGGLTGAPIPAGLNELSTGYPYISLPVTITIDPANPTITIDAANVVVEIYDNINNPPLNTVEINLDEVTLPAPTLSTDDSFWAFQKSGIYGDSTPKGRFDRTLQNPTIATNRLITETDSVQTYILPHGDYRALYGPTATNKEFEPVPSPGGATPNLRHFLSDLYVEIPGVFRGTSFALDDSNQPVESRVHYAPPMLPLADYPAGMNAPWTLGDWDTGAGVTITDGPLINKTDEGSLFTLNGDNNPYFQDVSYAANQATEVAYGEFFHSANRQMPSAVMFGSLPTGLISGQPWQTLLFRPTPLAHPGKTDPPDRLLLDLFWMPVVEPYAISEPFSTAGKINMNFQMIPFTYIERSTALQAVLMNERILAVPDTSWAGALVYDRRSPPNFEFSLPLNVEETLTPFHDKFQDGDVFLSATEITDLYLVPDSASATYAGMESFWNANRMTGDNLRERPYAHIYPRLTTKSNVFKVHYRVESLRKRPNSDPTIWDETRDKVVASSRGNTLIERFIDLNQSGIRDFATDATANAETLYRFRILSTKEFTP